MNDLSDREVKDRVVIHAVMFLVWAFTATIVIIFRDRVTWVLGFTAVVYIALDELVNAFFFWVERHKRIMSTTSTDTTSNN